MRLILASAALLASAAATPAFAQDQEERFNGFYVGLSGGATFQNDDENETIVFDRDLNGQFGDTVTTGAGANAFSPGFCSGTVAGATPSGGCQEADDVQPEYSGRAGFDYQMGAFVVGAIAEFGFTHVEDSVTAFSTTPASYTITRDIDYLANIRARLGFTVTPRTLVYASGGVAYAKLDNMFATTNTANANEVTGDEDSWGYAAGAGVEHLITDRISVGVEYLYQQLDDNVRVRLSRGTAPATNPFVLGNAEGTDFARSNDKFDLQSVRAVLNFRF